MHAQAKLLTATGIIAALAACVAAWGQSQPASQPQLDPVVDKILTRLESRQVNDLRARVRWELTYAVEEDEDADIKFGQIWYKHVQPVPKFLVHFDAKITGDRKDKLDEKHMFDGRWYTEVQSRTKTITRREIRRPDDPSNPYKIGEGPFPLPFGQKKADILREFEATRVPPAKSDPPATDHLKLVPREGTQTGQTYKVLDFWVSNVGPHSGLPAKVRTAKKDGTGRVNSYITITFDDIQLNTGFSDSVFKIEKPVGYEYQEEKLEPIPPPPGAARGKPEE
jgi:hypothetical protein